MVFENGGGVFICGPGGLGRGGDCRWGMFIDRNAFVWVKNRGVWFLIDQFCVVSGACAHKSIHTRTPRGTGACLGDVPCLCCHIQVGFCTCSLCSFLPGLRCRLIVEYDRVHLFLRRQENILDIFLRRSTVISVFVVSACLLVSCSFVGALNITGHLPACVLNSAR